jgi:hypothetical protein
VISEADERPLRRAIATAEAVTPSDAPYGSRVSAWPIASRLPSLSLNHAARSPTPPLLG